MHGYIENNTCIVVLHCCRGVGSSRIFWTRFSSQEGSAKQMDQMKQMDVVHHGKPQPWRHEAFRLIHVHTSQMERPKHPHFLSQRLGQGVESATWVPRWQGKCSTFVYRSWMVLVGACFWCAVHHLGFSLFWGFGGDWDAERLQCAFWGCLAKGIIIPISNTCMYGRFFRPR